MTLIIGPRKPRGNELKKLNAVKAYVKEDMKAEMVSLAEKMDQDSGITKKNYAEFVDAVFAADDNSTVPE